MACFLVQVGYPPEAWAALIKNPQDRSAAVRPAIETLGEKVRNFWLSFGDHDIIGVLRVQWWGML